MIDILRKSRVRMRRATTSAMVLALVVGGISAANSARAADGTPLRAAIGTSLNPDGTLQVVALGDSYTAGHGASTSYDNLPCRVSPAAYAQVAYRTLRAILQPPTNTDAVNLACTGGTIETVLDLQLDAEGGPTELTEVVLLTIGGNDVHFADVARTCVLNGSAVCNEALNEAEPRIETVREPLGVLLGRIKERAPNAKVVVSGYPVIFDTGACGLLGIAEDNRDHIRTLQWRFNDVIREVVEGPDLNDAAEPRFLYADANALFEDHRVCDDDPWINQVTDAIAQGDTAAAYHPNAMGHRAMAQVIIERLLDAQLSE